MRLGTIIKEKLARVIGTQFTTNQIVNIFEAANIPTDKSLFAKWRITLNALNQITSEGGFSKILSDFCHPLNFQDPKDQSAFINGLNNILGYENLRVENTGNQIQVILNEYGRKSLWSGEEIPKEKTSTDYVIEAVNFFKDEYNKARIEGITYEYPLGENIESEQVEGGRDEYEAKLHAIQQLKDIGFITEFKIKDKIENQGYYIWDYAICKINESKITQKQSAPATDAGVQAVAQKIIHEHTHRFENNIQEKPIDLNIKEQKQEQGKPNFPYKLPAGTKWEDFIIKFIDNDNILIKVKQFEHTANYKEMGFVGKGKNPDPSETWVFLKVLAQVNGELTIKDPASKDRYKKQKELLAKSLKNYFSLEYDPFFPYQSSSEKEGRSYKIKATLIPPVQTNNPQTTDSEEESEKTDDLGINEFLKTENQIKYQKYDYKKKE